MSQLIRGLLSNGLCGFSIVMDWVLFGCVMALRGLGYFSGMDGYE